jgi:replication factor C subunit 3/5
MYGTTQLSSMVLELNASDTRGIDDIRDQVVTFASTRKIFSSGMKLVILDEADNMTRDAQFALRRVIEKYTANTRFCMICNYVSKIIPALQSRCTRFRFSPLQPEQVKGRVREICVAEDIDCTEDGMDALLKLAKGDMRKVLNLLESSAMQKTENDKPIIDAGLVYQVAGKPTPDDIDQIVEALLNDPIQLSAEKIGSLQIEKGLALSDIVTELHERIRDMDIPADIIKFLLKELAEAEFRLSTAVDDEIQRLGIISIFMQARRLIEKALMQE